MAYYKILNIAGNRRLLINELQKDQSEQNSAYSRNMQEQRDKKP
jgi:hypothetical protein